MAKELCVPCYSWQKCFYEGYSETGLLEARQYKADESCPNIDELIKEARKRTERSLSYPTPLQTVNENENFNGDNSQEEKQKSKSKRKKVEMLPVPPEAAALEEIIAPTIPENLPALIETMLSLPTTEKQPVPPAVVPEERKSTPKSNVSVGLRAYIDVQEYLLTTQVPDYLWGAFGFMVESIDKTGKYPQDLSPKERQTLSDVLMRIMIANDVFDDNRDASRFLKSLAAMLFIWTYNTRGKEPDQIPEPN